MILALFQFIIGFEILDHLLSRSKLLNESAVEISMYIVFDLGDLFFKSHLLKYVIISNCNVY